MTADTGASTTADTGAAMTADTGAAMTADNVGPIPSALLTIPARPPMRQGAQVFNSVTEQWVEHYDEQSPENDFVSSTPANDHIEVSTVEGNVFSPLPDTMSSPKPLDHTNVQAPSTRVQASRSVKRGLPLDDGMSSDLGEDEYGKDARGRTILESTEDGDTDDLADEVVSDTDVVVPPIVSARRKRAASSNRKTKGGGKSEKARGKEKAVDTDADVEDNGTGEATSGGSNDVMLGEWMGKLQSFKDQLELNADGLSKGQEWKKGPLSKDGQQLVFELLELFDGTLNTLSRVVEKPPEVLLGYMGFTANGYRNINSFNIHQHKYKHDPETAKKQDETAAAWKKRCKKEYNKIEAKLDEEGYTAKEKRDYWFKVAQEQPMGTNDEQIWSGANTKKQLLRMTEGLSKQSAAYGRLLRVHVMGVVCYVGSALSGGNQFFQTWGNTPETQEFIELNGVYMKDFSMYMRTVFS
ncbi:hypothetical protein BXZ70DRAFT_748012 [Cristinia sonorae]|uniref:Uncharacterized protein n=1 Tax=Cristinia sonorae TaxID=1940300 RepID=A0A8K0UDX7_9AGAR|nr:hypothetical protein BXZ70DRAFT_748012 [Cristinia sonorae]